MLMVTPCSTDWIDRQNSGGRRPSVPMMTRSRNEDGPMNAITSEALAYEKMSEKEPTSCPPAMPWHKIKVRCLEEVLVRTVTRGNNFHALVAILL